MDFVAKFNSLVDSVQVSAKDRNGEVIRRNLPLKEFIALLQRNSYTPPTNILFPPTPREYLGGMVSSDLDNGDMFFALSEHDNLLRYKPRDAKKGKVFRVHYPNLLFRVVYTNRKVTNLFVWAFQKELKTDPLLYILPLGNVYNDGRICLGGNIIEWPNPQIGWKNVLDVFFQSPMNDDLYQTDMYGKSLGCMLESVQEHGFDFTIMHPCKKASEAMKKLA